MSFLGSLFIYFLFFYNSFFKKSLDVTSLVLILKKCGVEDLKDFKPIGLVRGLNKLLVKALANKLKKVMGKVVSNYQHSLVEGRQVLNVVLIANEAID